MNEKELIMSRFKKISLLLLVLIVFLVGCAKTEVVTESNGETPATSEQSSTTEIKSEVERDHVRTSYVQQVTTSDPHKNTGIIAANQILWQTFEPLFRVEATESKPLLATSYEVSDDGLVYTFHLRENVKFHNGDPMKADDVIWSINRAMENSYYANRLNALKEIRKIDDKTIQVVLHDASAYFFNAFNEICIISKRAVDEAGEDYGTKAVDSGTGPYRQTYFKGDTKVELEAFPDYYLGEAAVKKVTFTLIIDASTLYVAFQNGELDFTTIPESNWQEVIESGKYNHELAKTDHTTYLLLNNNRAPLNDMRIRQAINYAINRDEIVIMSYEGLADIAYLMANPSNVFGATLEGFEIYEYNPEKARQLLADAGYANGLDLTITSANIYFFEKIANTLQAELADVGINAKIEILEASAARAKYPVGDYDIGVMGLNVEKTVDFMYVYYDLENGNKYMQLTDDYPRQLLAKARKEMDSDTRLETYKEFCKYINEQAFTAPLFHRYMPYAWDKDLHAEIGVDYYFLYDFSWN